VILNEVHAQGTKAMKRWLWIVLHLPKAKEFLAMILIGHDSVSVERSYVLTSPDVFCGT